MKDDLYKDIIIKFLQGDATPHEKSMLSNWLKDDTAREEIFYYYLSIRESENPQHLPEIQSKAHAFDEYLHSGVQMPTVDFSDYRDHASGRSRSLTFRWWLAASVLLIISASLYFFQDSFLYNVYAAENGTIRSVTLDDGSTVTLNANSSIKVLRDFMNHENREVWIEGEAFFEISKKSDLKKFIVHTNNFDVEVLGTKFNINNRRCKSEVTLAEGQIKLVAKDLQPIIMEPGEQVTMSKSREQFEKQVVEPGKYEAWRNNMLVFENTPLSEVTEIVQDYYGVKMILSDSLLAKRQFTGTLPNNDLDVILLALRASYKINIEKKDNHIFLSN